MGADFSETMCVGITKVCNPSTATENGGTSYRVEARRHTIKKGQERKQETENLKILSKLLKESKDKQTLYNQCISPSSYRLLYRGSKKRYKISSLHSACDNVSNIFIIIESTDNNTFGAYSSKGLDSERLNSYIEDGQAFIFSITKAEIFNVDLEYKRYALFNSDHRLLQIGGSPGCDADICIIENCHKSKGSFVLKNIYSHPNDGYLNGGSKDFQVRELLIYTVSNDYVPLKHADNSYETAVADNCDEEDDNISYAESADYADEIDEEHITDNRKFHVYVYDRHKLSEFTVPELSGDIDTKSVNYAGCVIGNDWDETSKSNVDNLSLDITNTLKTLKINRGDCKVIIFVENEENGNKLQLIDTVNYGEEEKEEMVEYKPMIPSIAEHAVYAVDDVKIDEKIELIRKKSAAKMDRKKQMAALRMKYSSRRVVLHGKNRKKTPQCSECNTYYHIQSDPINAYGGIGIVCDICEKNRKNNPEMVLEEHYYKCENCEAIDICSDCYKKEKRKLNEKHKNRL